MSLASTIVGLPGLEIEKVDHGQGIHVWARPQKRPPCIHCGQHSLRVKASYQRTIKHTRLGNRVMLLHLRVPKYHCAPCNRYFRHRFPGLRARYRATDAYRLEVFEAHDGGVTQRKLSGTHQVSEATVERWYQHHVKQRLSELSNRPCPQILGIDEHFFSRRKGYATTLVDLKNHKVFDIVLGRSEMSLRRYLKGLQGRDQVQIVVMDLSETYRRIIRTYFPNAIIVADRFHVVRLVNHHFLKQWKRYDEEGRKSRGLLSLMRRHEWNLDDDQRLRLMDYLNEYPVLKALYEAKQKLMRFLLIKAVRKKHAEKFLPRFLQLIERFENSPAHALAKTLKSWLDPIVRMWRFPYSNGITEGFHNKMEMMSRRAYGFRNFENYRTRVLVHCGWDGIINRV